MGSSFTKSISKLMLWVVPILKDANIYNIMLNRINKFIYVFSFSGR